jgi:membrane protein implicated in regulation of membrane protease activity
MPLDRFVLIIVCVVAAAAVTVWVATALIATTQLAPIAGLAVLSVVALAAYIAWRVFSERVNNKDDDHYDRFEN